MPSLSEVLGNDGPQESNTSLSTFLNGPSSSGVARAPGLSEIAPPPRSIQKVSPTLQGAVTRGTDNTQATLFAATQALGSVMGADPIEQFGKEGLERNLEEASKNPPRIERFDDIDSLADVGTYFVEAVGEQIPQLAMDAILGTSTGGSALFASKVARASLGKSLLRKMPLEQAEQTLDNIARERFKNGFTAGFYTGIYGQVAGETQLEFEQRGIDNPELALIAGIPKTLLERFGLESAILKTVTKTGVQSKTITDALQTIGRDTILGMGTEGSTEGLQGLIDNIAVASQDPTFDISSRDNLMNLADQTLKGAIVGGALTAPIAGVRELRADTNGNVEDTPTPESPEQLDAQLDNILDPGTQSDTVIITPGASPSDGKLDNPAYFVEELPTGFTVVTTDEAKIQALQDPAIRDDPEAQQVMFGQFIGSVDEGKKPNATKVVTAKNAKGQSLRDILVSDENLDAQVDRTQQDVPEGGSLEVNDVSDVIKTRANPNVGEFEANMEIDQDDLPTATEFDFQENSGFDGMQLTDVDNPVISTGQAAELLGSEQTASSRSLAELVAEQVRDVQVFDNPKKFLADKFQALTALGYLVTGARTTTNENQETVLEGFKPTPDGKPEPSLYNKVLELQEENPFIEFAVVKDPKKNQYFIQQKPLSPFLVGENAITFDSSGTVSESFVVKKSIARAKQGQPNIGRRTGALAFVKVDDNGNAIQTNSGESQRTYFHIPTMMSSMLDVLRSDSATTMPLVARQRLAAIEALAQLAANGYMPDFNTQRTDLGTLLNTLSVNPSGVVVGNPRTLNKIDADKNALDATLQQHAEILQAIDNKVQQIDQAGDENPQLFEELEALIETRKRSDAFMRKRGLSAQNLETESELVQVVAQVIGSELQFGRPESALDVTDPGNQQRDTNQGIHRDNSRASSTQPHTKVFDSVGKPIHQAKGVKFFGRSITGLETNFVKAIVKATGVLANVIVTDVDGVRNDPHLSAIAGLTAKEFRVNPELQGRTLGLGPEAIIILRSLPKDATAQQVGERMLVLGHELGHIVYRSHVDNLSPGIKRAMYAIFKQDGSALSFEEWTADKFGAWALAQAQGKTKNKTVADTVFSAISSKLRKIWTALRKVVSPELRERFTRSRDFERVFIQNVLQASGVNHQVKKVDIDIGVFTDNMSIDPASFDMSAFELKRITKAIRNNVPRYASNMLKVASPFILTGHQRLKLIGATKLAKMFYHDSQSIGEGSSYFNILQSRITEQITNYDQALPSDPERRAKVLDIMQKEWTSETIARLEPDFVTEVRRARVQHRQFLTTLNAKMGNRIGNVADHFPRVFNAESIMDNPQVFDQVLAEVEFAEEMQTDPDNAIRRAGEIREQILDAGGVREFIDSYAPPGMDSRLSRTLVSEGLSEAMQEAGFLHEGEDALQAYIVSAVKRAEFENIFGQERSIKHVLQELHGRIQRGEFVDVGMMKRLERMQNKHNETYLASGEAIPEQTIWDANFKLKEELNKLNHEDRIVAQKVVDGYMGRLGLDMSPRLKHFQSWIMVLEFTTTLAFAALASVPDIGNIMIRAKDPLTAMKGFSKLIKNRADAMAQAKALGILHERFTSQALLNSFGSEFFDERTQKVTDTFFKWTGLTAFTEMTRTAAATMAEVFIEENAPKALQGDERAIRYLQELGITAEQVQLWQKQGKPVQPANDGDSNTRAIRDAMSRFVDESILRPNPAQRPIYGSDPRFALVWQLKSFFYSFGTVIIGGIGREIKARRAAGDTHFEQSVPLILAAVALLPLAALGLELRERVKEILHAAVDEPYTPQSDRLSTGEYLFELFDRAGGLGPLTILRNMFTSADYGNSVLLSVGGPAFGHAEMMLDPTKSWESKLKRTTPGQQLIPF